MSNEPAEASSPVQSTLRWFNFRWRTLLILPLAVAVLVAIYGPRQYRQRQALLALKQRQAIVRADPVAIPLLYELAGAEYAQEIREVYLLGPRFGDADLALLSGLGSLQKLEVADANVTDEGLSNLTGCSNLYNLQLAGTRVTDAGLSQLASLNRLGILSLSRTSVSDAGLEHLQALDQLERLFLDGTSIGDEGLAHLARLANLRELSLNDTRISDAGLRHLHSLARLELFKADNTRISPAGIEALRRAIPGCQVLLRGADE